MRAASSWTRSVAAPVVTEARARRRPRRRRRRSRASPRTRWTQTSRRRSAGLPKIAEEAPVPIRVDRRGPVALGRWTGRRSATRWTRDDRGPRGADEVDDDLAGTGPRLASSAQVFTQERLATGSGPPTGRGGPTASPAGRRVRDRRRGGTGTGRAASRSCSRCDMVVASTRATFGLPEVARGLVAACGGLFRGPRALPLNVATELLLTGAPIGCPAGRRARLVRPPRRRRARRGAGDRHADRDALASRRPGDPRSSSPRRRDPAATAMPLRPTRPDPASQRP